MRLPLWKRRELRNPPWGFRVRGRRQRRYLEPITGARSKLKVGGFSTNIVVGPAGVVELDNRDGIELLP